MLPIEFCIGNTKTLIYQGFKGLVADVADNITNKYKSNKYIYKYIYIGVRILYGNNGNKNPQKPHNDGLCSRCRCVADNGNKYIKRGKNEEFTML